MIILAAMCVNGVGYIEATEHSQVRLIYCI